MGAFLNFPRFGARWRATLRTVALMGLFVLAGGGLRATEPNAADRLFIESSSAPAPLGQKARMNVDPLTRKDGKFIGTYQLTVSPLGFGSEKGKLSVSLSDEALHKATQGETIQFKGEATNENGKNRTIEGEATPAGADRGSVRMRITSEKGKLIFNTTYRIESK